MPIANAKISVEIMKPSDGEWYDVTTDVQRIGVNGLGLSAARSHTGRIGSAEFTFVNTTRAYSPDSDASSSSKLMDIRRRIRVRTTGRNHGKCLQVKHDGNPALAYFYQNVSTTISAGQEWVLAWEARAQWDSQYNADLVEIVTGAENLGSQIFSYDTKWRQYEFVVRPSVGSTQIEVRFYPAHYKSAATAAAAIEYKNFTLVYSSDVLTNGTFANGLTTPWAAANSGSPASTVTLAVIDDYKIIFNGLIEHIKPAPFATAGDKTTLVTASDWLLPLETQRLSAALQKNKRADELIALAISALPQNSVTTTLPGAILEQGRQTFSRAFDGYTKRNTRLIDAIADAAQSEDGFYWMDADGTFRFVNNTYQARRIVREGRSWLYKRMLLTNPTNGTAAAFLSANFTFVTALTTGEQVLIGATTDDTAANVAAYLNRDPASAGVKYLSTVPPEGIAGAVTGYNATIKAAAPSRYYRLGEAAGTSAADTGSDAQNGTYVNGVTLGATGALSSDADKAATFDGTNDNVSIPTLDIGSKSFSVELWVKPAAAPPANQDVFSCYSAFVADQAFYVRIASTGAITVDFYLDAFTSATGVIGFAGAWYHLVVTHDYTAQITTLYVNGLQIARATSGPFKGATPTVTAGAFPAAGTYFKGDMDEIAVYLRALSAAEVRGHYAARYTSLTCIKTVNYYQTPQLVLAENQAFTMAVVRSGGTLLNKATVTWTPRETKTANSVLTKINSSIRIPPKDAGQYNSKHDIAGLGAGGSNEIGKTTVTLSFVDSSGKPIGGEDVITPLVAGTDYKVFEFDDPTNPGVEYTNSPYLWISDVKVDASQITLTFNNAAIGALFVTLLQVRGKAVLTYDPVQTEASNQASIDTYQLRETSIDMPFTNSQTYAESKVRYLVNRYGTPFAEAQWVAFENTDYFNGFDLLTLDVTDLIAISDVQTNLSNTHMITRLSYVLSPLAGRCVAQVRFDLERLDANTYWILNDFAFGKLNTTARLYI